MTLGNEDNPIVLVWKQESELQGETWIEDDEVVAYEHSGGHILRDLAWYTSIVTRHKALGLGVEARRLTEGHTARDKLERGN